jgi:RNA polymerase sigma-70 factor (ECF subfamily)
MNAPSVEDLFTQHRGRVYRWAYAMCGRHEASVDTVQEVFLRLVRRAPQFEHAAAAVAWLRRVTGRVVLNLWRHESTRRRFERGRGMREPIEEAPTPTELPGRLLAALTELTEQQRLVLMAKCYDDMTFSEIALELGISAPTAKTHYVRALAAVRDHLGIHPDRAAVAAGSIR